MVAIYNWTWQQGDDLVMSLVYKEGPEGATVAKDLTGHQLRMDIVKDGALIYVFNSNDIGGNMDAVGNADNEAALNANGELGTIKITVPRSLTLPGGKVHSLLMAEDGDEVDLNYDIFLRDTTGKQHKFLKGTITVEASYTLWQ